MASQNRMMTLIAFLLSGAPEPGCELDPGSLDDRHWCHGNARLLAFCLTRSPRRRRACKSCAR
jgi:hypothetical protein